MPRDFMCFRLTLILGRTQFTQLRVPRYSIVPAGMQEIEQCIAQLPRAQRYDRLIF